MSSVTFSDRSALDTMESSRLEVMECEKEIQSIKDSLKSLNVGAGSEDGLNSLKVAVHKVKFVEDSKRGEAPCTFKVHLSSPIEERTIAKLHDPLDPGAEGSFALFTSLETSNALLTMEVFSGADGSEVAKLGVSAAHDLLPLCQDMKQVSGADGNKSLMVDFAIVSEIGEQMVADVKNGTGENDSKISEGDSELAADKDSSGGEVTEENNGEHDGSEAPGVVAEETKPAQDSSNEKVKESKVQVPVCTLSVHLEYTPSLNDKRDTLYDKLNEVSKRKAAAIELLRKSASAVNRAKMEEGLTSDDKEKNTVVKSGFLNKSKASQSGVKNVSPPFWKRWYDKTIGPQSMFWVVGPIAKNYLIFFAVSVFFHYKGDLLALPPPV